MADQQEGGVHRPPLRPAGWLVLGILVVIASFGLLGLPSLGLHLLGTKGTAVIFALGEVLGAGAIGFVIAATAAARRGELGAAAEDLHLARRWSLAGTTFVVGMFALAAASHLIPAVMTS